MKLSARDLRRNQKDATIALGQVIPAVNQLLHNEGIARDKITALEDWRQQQTNRTFRQRLRWLFKGV